MTESWKNQKRDAGGQFGELLVPRTDVAVPQATTGQSTLPDVSAPSATSEKLRATLHARLIDTRGFGGAQTPEEAKQRQEALLANKYVPARASQSTHDIRYTDDRDKWWDRQWADAEWNDKKASKEYPKMPDDWTPRRTYGRASSKLRRTHRMRYSHGDVEIRMPSKTSCNSYAKFVEGTFDVPVEVRSNETGNTVTGWVRVTKGQKGAWAAEPLGFTNDTAAASVQEAVLATLESRRYQSPKSNKILEQHRARVLREGAELHPVETSSWVKGAAYVADPGMSVIQTRDKKGVERFYAEKTTPEEHQSIFTSDKVGSRVSRELFHNEDRPSKKMTQCPRCHRVYLNEVADSHTCPVPEKKANVRKPEYRMKVKKVEGKWKMEALGTLVGDEKRTKRRF